jgi:glycosyltransferase involved in cell wall biosynthesis
MEKPAYKIVKLCAQHHPLDGRLFHLEAKALFEAGHDVTIIAPRQDGMPEHFDQDGIHIRTYQKLYSGIRRKAYTLSTLCKLAKQVRADVYHAHEMDAALFAGAYAKNYWRRNGHPVKLVFDAHEAWPYFYAAATNNLLVRRFAVHAIVEYERRMLTRHVDAVITAHKLEQMYYLWQNPFISVRHVLTSPTIRESALDKTGPIRVIGHEGYLTLNRGMNVLLRAFELLAAEFSDLTLVTAGDFLNDADRSWFDNWAKRTGLRERVMLSGWVNRPDLPALLDSMDIGVVALREDEHSSRIWPANKLMNYASRGITPVVCASMPLARQKVEERGIGRVVPFDVQRLYHCIRELILDPDQCRALGKRAWTHAKKAWDWEQYRLELLHTYDDLAIPTHRPRKSMKLQG